MQSVKRQIWALVARVGVRQRRVRPGVARLDHGPRRGFVGRRTARRHGHRRQRRHQLDADGADERQRDLHRPLPRPRPLHAHGRAERVPHHAPEGDRARRRPRGGRLHARAGGQQRGDLRGGGDARCWRRVARPPGQVMDSKIINEIPLGDGTAYSLTRLVPGATFERAYALQRPMDNDNLRGVTVSGTISSEFTLDGTSNVGSQARVAIQPPADAIQEFKVETATYDASVGHTGAGTVNLALKGGGNDFHGAASFYNRDDSRSANLFASNARGTAVTPRDYNRFQGFLSGPIIKNKTFFALSYEKLNDDTIETVTGAVPTERMRNGDFSELLGAGVRHLRPADRAQRERRDRPRPLPGQHHPAEPPQPGRRATSSSFYPLPNQAGAADFTGNFFAEQPWTYSYYYAQAQGRPRVVAEPQDVPALHPQLPARGALQLGRRAERHRHLARRHRPLQLERRARPHHGPEPHPGVRPARRASCASTTTRRRPSPSQTLDLAELGFSAPDGRRSSAATRTSRMFNLDGNAACPAFPNAANPVFCLGGNQNGFNSGRLQPFYNLQIVAHRHEDRGQPHVPRGLRLAQPPPERGERGLPRRPVPLRQHVHAPGQQRHRPLRPGRRRLPAGPAHERLVHRGPLHAVLRGGQPRRLHPRRLARQLQADPERGRALRPGAAA